MALGMEGRRSQWPWIGAWPRDAALAAGLVLVGIVSRAVAIPASSWEWDDFLFARALHPFDILEHSPPPPGFPLFVMLGRAAYAAVGDEQRAYAVVAFVFAALLMPSLFYLYREIFDDPPAALAAALIGGFAPSVWIHGVEPRSDGPALTLGIIGLTLVIRGL